MYSPTTRLLSILDLLQSRGEMRAQDLAQVLEVQERSIRRYITTLRDMGIPIEGERGRNGGYSLRPGFRLPPLIFDHAELIAVMVGLMLMRELGSTSNLAIEHAAAKIERVLPEELRQQSDALRQTLTVEDARLGAHALLDDLLVTFSLAVHEARCLHITYTSASGEVTQRVISPYGVVLHGRSWYVAAYCHARMARRIFRLDRVRVAAPSDAAYVPAPDFDARAFVISTLARMPNTHAFEVLLHVPLETAQEVIAPTMAILEREGQHTLMRCYSDDPYWLARYLAQLEIPFTVRRTDALRDALRTIARNIFTSLGVD